MKKLLVLTTLILSVCFLGCTKDTKVILNDHKDQITSNTVRIELIEAGQLVQDARLDALELADSSLYEAVSYLEDHLGDLEETLEELLSNLEEEDDYEGEEEYEEYLEELMYAIYDLEERIEDIEDDLEDLMGSNENSSACVVELRDERETRKGIRADIFIVCGELEYQLRNNAKLGEVEND